MFSKSKKVNDSIRYIVLSFILITSFHYNAFACHIVGGEMTYECLGDNVFRIHMTIYKDCDANSRGCAFTTVAPFDQFASFTVFPNSKNSDNFDDFRFYDKDDPNAPNNVLQVIGLDRFGDPVIVVSEVDPIPENRVRNEFNTVLFEELRDSFNVPPNFPLECLVSPPDICVEETEYIFDILLPDVVDPLGYTVSYQRCCRNNTITNLNNPETVGATFNVTITPDAIANCNNSPEFNVFPPIIICDQDPIDFTHSAIDVDGDSLVYRFCTPLDGGSINLPQPQISSLPPFDEVPFSTGFSGTNPMNGDPFINIDSNTGYIDGSPNGVGQYVVGICVDEYRDNDILSTIRRDFQFNVTPCQKRVVADIREDGRSNDNDYIVRSCGENIVTIVNESTQEQFINSYYWEIDRGSLGTFTSTDKDVTLEFPGVGTYTGVMVLNRGEDICADSANLIIEIYPPIEASFDYTQELCSLETIPFTDESIITTNTIETWEWSFGDGDESNVQNPSHLFGEAGNYTVNLNVIDENGCFDDTSQVVEWFPSPNLDIDYTSQQCDTPLLVEFRFSNTAGPFNGYIFDWDFDGGIPVSSSTMSSDPDVLYTNFGRFNPEVIVTSPTGCFSRDTFPIGLFKTPTIDFNIIQDTCTVAPIDLESIVILGDTAVNIYNWDLGDNTFASTMDVNHQYSESGVYTVQLNIQDENTCVDTVTKEVTYFPVPTISVDGTPRQGCESLDVQFVNNSTPTVGYDYFWRFNDGNTSSLRAPSHTFDMPGSYTPKFIISSPITGCIDSVDLPLFNVYNNPVANWERSADSCLIKPITFTDLSTSVDGTITDYDWGFGNTTTGNQSIEIVDYNNSGSYSVRLEVTDSNDCKDTLVRNLNYFPTPNIDLSLAPNQGCDTLTVLTQNNTFPTNGYDIIWNFGDGNTSTELSPTHFYDQTGTFTPTFEITSLLSNCINDTTLSPVIIYQSPTASYSYTGDSCDINAVFEFEDESIDGDGTVFQWSWDFGDNFQGIGTSVDHVYAELGLYPVELAILDDNGCVDTVQESVPFFPIPELDVTFDTLIGCAPAQFNIINNTQVPASYSWLWDFGNGEMSPFRAPTVTYEDEGVYTISGTVTSPSGCTDDSFTTSARVLETPIAGFNFTPLTGITSLNPEVTFINTSEPAGRITDYLWDFDSFEGDLSNRTNPIYSYNPLDTGLHQVALTASIDHGAGLVCNNTTFRELDVVPVITYFLPNAFTPNGDDVNDFYRGNGVFLEFLQDFELTIWNRWGELIFETNDPFEAWNGQKFNTGAMSQNGVYVCIVNFRGPRGQEYKFKEFSTIVR